MTDCMKSLKFLHHCRGEPTSGYKYSSWVRRVDAFGQRLCTLVKMKVNWLEIVVYGIWSLKSKKDIGKKHVKIYCTLHQCLRDMPMLLSYSTSERASPNLSPTINFKRIVNLVAMLSGRRQMNYLALAREDPTNQVEGLVL